ncbi:unnamed protein product [Rotaria sordida]|uniref:NADP-dependent oxidoreductase domain-containing protein n=1 Tax=Rotaria sordida TaxID=392033 RepID=A0A814ZT49_9BILA|nr:unnamed protein product [Rotaria sordida]
MSQRITLPKVIFGTSGLGNLYVALEDKIKLEIVTACIQYSSGQKPVVFDCAGKYGAGLALETLGNCLKMLNIKPEDVLISNKLGWYRTTELQSGTEPTFESGVWRNLKYDAVQKISYKGILECYEQGNQLLNGYKAKLVSVHDPDEYVAGAQSQLEKDKRYSDIIEAYRALCELKSRDEVKAIGIGSKDWRMIQRIVNDVNLDWVMIANSMTVHSHPQELVTFMEELQQRGTIIINAAVFNGGFLIGEDYYNYRSIDVLDTTYRSEMNQGEVCIRGPAIFKGYYSDEAKTKEVIDQDGWLHTGDVGEWTSNGALRIIDRAKHIFKLSQGKYIAPERLEDVYIRSQWVAQIFIDGISSEASVVAIVIPDEQYVRKNFQTGTTETTFADLCKDAKLKQIILSDLIRLAEKSNLKIYETLSNIHLHPELFSHNNGFITVTFKVRRNNARKHFQSIIKSLYQTDPIITSKNSLK